MSDHLCIKYLTGMKGIEIGRSAHNSFPIDAINVDRYASMDTIYKQEEERLVGQKAAVDVVASGDDLPFEDKSYDFVFSSHVLEHFPDPIRALKEWKRVAKYYIICVIPHRDRTFDKDRDLTTLSELITRYNFMVESDEDKHWSVWTLDTFLELCDYLDLRVIEAEDPDSKVGNGFAVVIDLEL